MICCTLRQLTGAVAQLVERHNGIVEVVGSRPIGSTSHPDKIKAAQPLAEPDGAESTGPVSEYPVCLGGYRESD